MPNEQEPAEAGDATRQAVMAMSRAHANPRRRARRASFFPPPTTAHAMENPHAERQNVLLQRIIKNAVRTAAQPSHPCPCPRHTKQNKLTTGEIAGQMHGDDRRAEPVSRGAPLCFCCCCCCAGCSVHADADGWVGCFV